MSMTTAIVAETMYRLLTKHAHMVWFGLVYDNISLSNELLLPASASVSQNSGWDNRLALKLSVAANGPLITPTGLFLVSPELGGGINTSSPLFSPSPCAGATRSHHGRISAFHGHSFPTRC